MDIDYDELQGEIEDVEFGNMSINDCIYYNEVLDELSYAEFDQDGYIINEFTDKQIYHDTPYQHENRTYTKPNTNYNIPSSLNNPEDDTDYDDEIYNIEYDKLEVIAGLTIVDIVCVGLPLIIIIWFILSFFI